MISEEGKGMVDLNNLTEQEADDVAACTAWNALPPAVQAAIEANMSREDKATVRAAIGRAKNITQK